MPSHVALSLRARSSHSHVPFGSSWFPDSVLGTGTSTWMNPVTDVCLPEWVILHVAEDVDFKQEMVYVGEFDWRPQRRRPEWGVAPVPGASSGDL